MPMFSSLLAPSGPSEHIYTLELSVGQPAIRATNTFIVVVFNGKVLFLRQFACIITPKRPCYKCNKVNGNVGIRGAFKNNASLLTISIYHNIIYDIRFNVTRTTSKENE